MQHLDLHGVKHEDVPGVVIDACSRHDIPFIIITGHSSKMKQIVSRSVGSLGYLTRELISNSGRLIVDEE